MPTTPSARQEHPKSPLHGITLEVILVQLVKQHGWPALASQVPIQCFVNNPSIKSSLKFLRKTPWARARVEALYLEARVSRAGAPGAPQPSSDRLRKAGGAKTVPQGGRPGRRKEIS
jgi:uncharacterized protein (DUF2132 family)